MILEESETMARLQDTLIQGRAYAEGLKNPMLNLAYGGQFGFSTDIHTWVSNAAYVRRNMIPVLMEAPKFFQRLPDSDLWVRSLRALTELHPRSIDGINMTLTVESGETPVGGGGEVQEEVINSTRERSRPVFNFSHDKYGRPIQRMVEKWITWGLMDPNSKHANIGTLQDYPTDMLPDQYAMTMLFIEADPTHRQVIKSVLCTNMWPKGTGDITMKRDITSAMEIPELSIEFTALSQHGVGVNLLAQKVLDYMDITNANPDMRSAFLQDISEDVKVFSDIGYKSQIDSLARDTESVRSQV